MQDYIIDEVRKIRKELENSFPSFEAYCQYLIKAQEANPQKLVSFAPGKQYKTKAA